LLSTEFLEAYANIALDGKTPSKAEVTKIMQDLKKKHDIKNDTPEHKAMVESYNDTLSANEIK
jgi:hypothetical protein